MYTPNPKMALLTFTNHLNKWKQTFVLLSFRQALMTSAKKLFYFQAHPRAT